MTRLGWRLRLRNRLRIDAHNRLEIARDARVRDCRIHIKGCGNTLSIAPGANLRGVLLELRGDDNHLSIGEGTVIGRDCYLSARGSGTRLIIGADGMLSRNVKVMTGDGHDILEGDCCINAPRSIHIDDHVWLADEVTVLKGVSIGRDAVVGLGSIVTRDVPAGAIAAGNPARLVREGIHWVR